MKTILRALQGDGGDRFSITTNKHTQAIMEQASSLLSKLSGIDEISRTVLISRAMMALTMELAEITAELGQAGENSFEALDEERQKQKAILIRLAGRPVTVKK